jgi:UDP-N-acetylmuramoyl-tripeptide--D-alanyl-D-alanine ligase
MEAESLQDGKAKAVRDVVTDSRLAKKGSLYFAIMGPRNDGHDFIGQAVTNGATVVVVSKRIRTDIPGVWILNVNDTTKALGKLAQYYRAKFKVPVIAITGSAGKTTTKEMIAKALGSRFKVLKNKRTENNQFGVPMTLLKLRPKHTAVVIEVGTNHFGEIAYLAKIVRPDIAVMTNIGASHLEYLKSKAGVFREKFDLVRFTDDKGAVIFNGDDDHLKKIGTKSITQKKVSFGTANGADVRAEDISYSGGSMNFKVKKQRFRLKTITQHNVHNALAAIAVASVLKIDMKAIAGNLANWRSVDGRQCVLKHNGFTLINDTYNANPLSFLSAIKSLAAMHSKGRKLIVCGDMKELGKDSIKWHQYIGKEIGSIRVDAVMSIGKDAEYIGKAARSKNEQTYIRHFNDMGQLNEHLSGLVRKGDIVLVKGSRSMQMERVVNFLTETRSK